MRWTLRFGILALAASIVAVAGPLPQTQGPIAPAPGTVVQNPPQGSIRVRVAVVSTPVVVQDSKGELVTNLQQRNFRVLDNGVQQEIEAFDVGSEPISAALIFETSSRIAPLLPAVQKSAILFTQTVIGPSGDAAVLGFDDMVDRLLPFTADHDEIEKTIKNLKPGNSGARLYDALSTAVGLLRDRPESRRRVIIVVAEPRDFGSEERLGEVLREAQLSNIVIYSVGLSTTDAELRAPPKQRSAPPSATPPGTFGGPAIPGTVQTPTQGSLGAAGGGGGGGGGGSSADLGALAEVLVRDVSAVVKANPLEVAGAATGGMYRATFRAQTIENAVDAIGGELNAQYTLSYHPTGSDVAGYHQIKVTVDRGGLKVRSRPGYYLDQARN